MKNAENSTETTHRPVADVVRRLGDQIRSANNSYQANSDEVRSALRRWLDGLDASSIVSRIDRVQKWRNDLSKHLNDEAIA